jgi:hypothetical protein
VRGRSVSPSFEIVPYEAGHLRALKLQPAQASFSAWVAESGYAEKVGQAGPAWSALEHRRPIACAGFTFPWNGRAIAWAVLGDCGAEMLRVTRAVNRALADCPAERIECQVKANFGEALRWAKLLGFEREGLMRRFYEGEDYWSLAMVKSWN